MGVSQKTKEMLHARSGNMCAFEECHKILVQKITENNYIKIGECAHIKGDKPGTARYDSSQEQKERDSIENLILLCPEHHKSIDDCPELYSVDKLKKIKESHDKYIENLIKKEIASITFLELEMTTKYLLENSTESEDFKITPPIEKIQKNELSQKTSNMIKMGLSRANLMSNFISKQPTIEFGERLKQGFIKKYSELSETLKGDELFEAIVSFASKNSPKISDTSAGIIITSYFFETCDIFKK